MRALSIIRKLFVNCREWCHQKRFETLTLVVDALLSGARLTLTDLGRGLASDAQVKHSIKRVDRLLSNPRLYGERYQWWSEVARTAIGRRSRPVILVDWSALSGDWWTLSACVASSGRALPVYQEVHDGHRDTRARHDRFLARLRSVLPEGCQPVIVADAEFCSPFFQSCSVHGFDYVIRLRGSGTLYQGESFVTFRRLQAKATSHSQCLGTGFPYYRDRQGSYLRIVLGPVSKRRVRESDGYYQTRALEPWVLATTIQNAPADEVVRLYSLRMQIEESFRDTKNPRYGWALEYATSVSHERLEILLLIAGLALVVAYRLGLAAEDNGRARHFQANTESRRRVLSLSRLGQLVLKHARHRPEVASRRRLREIVEKANIPWTKFHRLYRGQPPHGLYCADCGDSWEASGWSSVE